MAGLESNVSAAQKHLDPGESVVAAVLGAYEGKFMGQDSLRNGVFLATDRRLVFFAKFFGYEMEVFPYANISSIEMGKTLMGHHFSFFASGNKASMKWISKGDVDKFVAHVKDVIQKKSATPHAAPPQPDIPDQIRKLAELRDASVLTEAEFQGKKAELLAKM